MITTLTPGVIGGVIGTLVWVGERYLYVRHLPEVRFLCESILGHAKVTET
jgi:hypothetical protein